MAQLAQVNLARLRFPPGSPRVREFMAAVERINRLADRAPGFVWRYGPGEDHLNQADPAEALARLRHLRTYGPSPKAFTVRSRFTPEGRRAKAR